MKSVSRFFLLIVAAAAINVAAADKPNVVIIYGDDVGYADVGAYGSKLIPTPNIDKLAAEGLRFTDGHCTAATCSPSRFAMLTGIHGFRHGVRILPPNAPMKIPTDIMTLPKVFQKAGYQTGIIGKWHLGIGDGNLDWNGEIKPSPLDVGFDYMFLLPSTNDRVPCVYVENRHVVNLDPKDPLFVGKPADAPAESTKYPDGKKNPEAMTYYPSSHGHNTVVINGIGRIGYMAGGKSALWDDETMTDEYVKQTKKYIAKHKDEPFFLVFSSQCIHVPRVPHPRFHGKTKLGYRGDDMVQFDWATGEIMKTLEEHGLTENTIVIFSSDNGPVYDDGYKDGTVTRTSTKETDQGHDGSGPYRGGKYQIYEGGTRVPFIIRWPKRIKPGVSGALVSQVSFAASFAELLDVELANEDCVDSRSTLAAFLGEDKEGLPYMVEEAGIRALRRGDWKYIAGSPARKRKGKEVKGRPGRLFDLSKDVGEQNDIAAAHPEIVKEMSTLLQKLVDDGRIRPVK
jgi:arylsulfatase A-like enzyme